MTNAQDNLSPAELGELAGREDNRLAEEMALKDMEKETLQSETKKNTASEAIQAQHATILTAIQLLQGELNEMTATTDPQTTSWKDVAHFAKTADLARDLCEAHAN